MQLSRRRAMALGAAGVGATLLPLSAGAGVDPLVDALTERFTGGAPLGTGALMIEAPTVAENGASVDITLTCPGARSIRLIAPANPEAEVFTVHFGPLAGSHRLTTRIRMAESMDLIALAQMEDGSFQRATARVSVTLGGCVG